MPKGIYQRRPRSVTSEDARVEVAHKPKRKARKGAKHKATKHNGAKKGKGYEVTMSMPLAMLPQRFPPMRARSTPAAANEPPLRNAENARYVLAISLVQAIREIVRDPI